MTTKTALRIAIPTPLRQLFDYLPPKNCNLQALQPGMRIQVPLKQRELVGILIATTTEPSYPWDKLKSASAIMDSEPIIPMDIWKLCHWASDYYHYPLGEVLAGALPVLLRQGKPAEFSKNFTLPAPNKKIKEPLSLNAAQQNAFHLIQAGLNGFHTFLLDGITGSGKTEVYLQVMTEVLNQQKQILVLVPEIGLTPQTIQRFRERYNISIVALHSKLNNKKRLDAWLAAKNGTAKIIIGTRSAIFTPFLRLGLIIVDEEHDLSFKQQEGFRYHARDLAIMRAHLNNIPIILGSATPCLETLHNAKQNRYSHLRLPERAGAAKLPEIRILDICKTPLEQGLSPTLLKEMDLHLKNKEQVMLFLNRRGFAPVLMCHSCGWMAHCKRCDIRMTYHQFPERLHCHHCETRKNVIKHCEKCGEKQLIAIGLGTERLEQVLEKHFPNMSIARIDRDTTQKKNALEKLLDSIHNGEHQIIIGTQMLAKGHHFPHVTLVAIIDADGGFFSSDFRALERMGQLLLQVGGRAGREEKPGKIMIQTHHPEHPLLHQLLRQSYHDFAMSLLKEREQAQLPPYFFFALFRAEGYDAAHAENFLQHIKTHINNIANATIRVSGPIPAPMPRRAGRYRAQLLIQSRHRPALQHFLKNLLPEVEKIPSKHRVRWSLDVDPSEMF